MIESKVNGVIYKVDGEEVEWHAAFHLFEFDYDDRYRFWSGVAQIDAEMDQPANIQFRLEDGRVGGGLVFGGAIRDDGYCEVAFSGNSLLAGQTVGRHYL